ncbi:MAG: hypothetical protein ACSLFQ_01625 [Thermoanaerobaculia bacterium]
MTLETERFGAAVARFQVALLCYAGSVALVVFGAVLAASRYPEGFDWTRHVISALASRKHNPEGSVWFAGGLALSLALLLPVVRMLGSAVGESAVSPRAMVTLRLGLVLGILVALERLVFFHVSTQIRKGHEILALLTFLLLYAGVLVAEIQQIRLRASGWWRAVMLVVPLVAIGLSELTLYLSQRGIGWLDHDWRQSTLPLFARFAFWQWLAAISLWVAMGHLLLVARPRQR